MIVNGLLGKIVKTDDYHFIGFLYPNFPFISHLLFNMEDIPGFIYTGGEHLAKGEKAFITMLSKKEDLSRNEKPFISTYSAYGHDIDLTGSNGRKIVLDLVYSHWGLDYSQYLDDDDLKELLRMEEQEFYKFVKFRWLSKKQCINNKDLGFYSGKDIAKLLNKPIEGIYAKVLYESDTSLDSLERALADFIRDAKVQNYSPNKSDEKNTMLKKLDHSINGKKKEFTIILSKYRNMNHHKKIKLMWLFTELKKQI